MTSGPPPSAAGPSQYSTSAQTANTNIQASTALQPSHAETRAPQPPASTASSAQPGSHASPQLASGSYYRAAANLPTFSVSSQAGPPNTPASSTRPSYQAGYYTHQVPRSGVAQPPGAYSYYAYPSNAWSNAWNTGTYQYPSASSYSYPYAAPQPRAPTPTFTQPPQPLPAPSLQKSKSLSPRLPTPPPPKYRKDWDIVIKSFLSAIGFSQAVRGFEADMIVLNPEWERKQISAALEDLTRDLLALSESKQESTEPVRPLEERKLESLHLAHDVEPRSPTTLTRDISRFLAQNRARNNASNCNEFLLTLAEKRRRLNEGGDSELSTSLPSCARTDAKTQNRDLQMKYDIAKNEDGPLRRTMKVATTAAEAETSTFGVTKTVQDLSAERHPGLDERLQNIEKHLAVRYVPSPPRSLLDRLKFLEDHLVHLEKEYPPWAALHFNQPNRGWPPPPRATPIIVPSHLTSTAQEQPANATVSSASHGEAAETGSAKGKGKAGRSNKSSLQRAVLEKLEVQKAIHDLAGDAG